MAKSLDTLFTPSNERLFDLLFRHQVYLEGVKAYFAKDFRTELNKLYAKFAQYLFANRYRSMDQFTYGELNQFIYKFRQEQQQFYSLYTQKLIDLLEKFVATDHDVTKRLFEVALGLNLTEAARRNEGTNTATGDDLTGPKVFSDADLWASSLKEPIPANGFLLKDWITAFFAGANLQVLSLLRQGYANGWTMQEMLDAIVGTSETRFRDGFFGKLAVQEATMINTIEQHISSIVQGSVASVYVQKYQWVAILDNRTTELCRNRNGTVYVYGEGPLPPAHYNCRSKAVPLVEGTKIHDIPATYYQWLKSQPEAFQNDVLGSDLASKLRSGALSAKNFTEIGTVTPLSLQQFASKIKFMLGE